MRPVLLPDGGVESIEVLESDVVSRRLEQCVVEVLGTARFSRALDGKPREFILPFGFDGWWE